MIDAQGRRLVLGLSVAVVLAAVGHEWNVQTARGADEALRHELAEVRRMGTEVDRLALNARSSTSNYDALADTLHTLRGHERRLAVPPHLAAAHQQLAEQIDARAVDIDYLKAFRSASRNSDRYLYKVVAEGDADPAWVNALSLFLLVPGEDSSPILKAATPTDDPILARHVKVVTDSRRELNKRVTNILQSGLGELASKLETAHVQERRAKGERARNVRLALLTLLGLLQLWVFRQG